MNWQGNIGNFGGIPIYESKYLPDDVNAFLIADPSNPNNVMVIKRKPKPLTRWQRFLLYLRIGVLAWA